MSETTKKPLIYAALAKVVAQVGAVGKNQRNAMQNYRYRGVEDVIAAVKPVMVEHGVFVYPVVVEHAATQELVGGKKTPMFHVVARIEFHFAATDGSEVVATTIGEGTDTGDKAANKAMTAAYKYALVETLMIPDELHDGDAESPGFDTGDVTDEEGAF